LGGAYLGLADIPAYRVQIDDDAAGRGWAIGKDEGQRTKDEGDSVSAFGLRPSSLDVDLLKVVMHELGHLLGYEHAADGLMAPVLGASAVAPSALGSRLSALDSRLWTLNSRE